MDAEEEGEIYTWDDSFSIARALAERYPVMDLGDVSLIAIYRWTVALPEFRDDPGIANDEILAAIYQEWLEITPPLPRHQLP
jgi:FeS assembly protein IscX